VEERGAKDNGVGGTTRSTARNTALYRGFVAPLSTKNIKIIV